MTALLKTQQSESLPGDLLHSGKQISSFSALGEKPQFEGPTGGLLQPKLQAYQETRSNTGTKEADSRQSTRPINTMDIQMVKGKHKTISNRSQHGHHQNPVLPTQQVLSTTTHQDEIDDFLDRYHIPKLSQEQKNYLNRPISNKEIEVIINFSTIYLLLSTSWYLLQN